MKWKKQAVIACICMTVLQWIIAGCTNQEPTDRLPDTDALSFSLMLSDPQTATRALESKNSTLQNAAKKSEQKAVPIPIYTYTKPTDGSFATYFTDGLVYAAPQWEITSGAIRFIPTNGMYLFSYYGTEIGDKGDLEHITFIPPSGSTYPKLSYEVYHQKRDLPLQIDLIACKLENYRNNHVKLPFRHILSQINFGVQGMSEYQISVFNIRINNVFKKGTFDYETWNWTPSSDLNNDIKSFDYYFPDWKDDFYQNIGEKHKRGENYITAGGTDDGNNIYIFGDGGNFAPDASGTAHWYAQLSGTDGYKQRDQSSKDISNSLMLLPQKIRQNLSASVTFDYVLKKNDVVVKQESGREIQLSQFGIDWEPNMRYVYLFQFDLPTDHITFDITLTPWENWDATDTNPGNGLKNGTIQEPTPATLNAIGDGEIIYLNGILERNLNWDWSTETKYLFSNVNFLDLDFAGVSMGVHEVAVTVPEGFTVTSSPASDMNRRLKIVRDSKQLFMPTDKQISLLTDQQTHKLYGSLTESISWDWRYKSLASLGDGMSCTLDFTAVDFNGYTLTLILPVGYTVTPSSVNSNTSITIKNEKTYPVEEPVPFLLAVMSQGGEIDVKGGTVSSATTWNWSAENVFPNLSPQQSFKLDFAGVYFGGNPIALNLPKGFRASGSDSGSNISIADEANSKYNIISNGGVTIKNNRIEYPSAITMNGVYNGASVALVGEKISSDPDVIDWTTGGITFPNLFRQNSFTLDLSGVEYISSKNIKVKMPEQFEITAGSYTGTNPYIFAVSEKITIKNNPMTKPTNEQLNAMTNGGQISLNEGKLVNNETWDWGYVPFSNFNGSDTGNGGSFTVDLSTVNFNSKKLTLLLAGFDVTKVSGTGNVSYVFDSTNGPSYTIDGPGVYRITDKSYTMTAANATKLCTLGNNGIIAFSGYDFNNSINGDVTFTLPVATNLNITSSGQQIYIDYRRIKYFGASSRIVITNSAKFAGYSASSLYTIPDPSSRILIGNNSLSVRSWSSQDLRGIIVIITKN